MTRQSDGVIQYTPGSNGWSGGYITPAVDVTSWQTVNFYVYSTVNNQIRFELKNGSTTVFDHTFSITGSAGWQLMSVDVSGTTPAASSINYCAISQNSSDIYIGAMWIAQPDMTPPAAGQTPSINFLSDWHEGEHGDSVQVLNGNVVKYSPGVNGWTGGYINPSVDVTGWQTVTFYLFSWGATQVRFECKTDSITVLDETISLTGSSSWQTVTINVASRVPANASFNYMAISGNSIPVYIGGIWVATENGALPLHGQTPSNNILSQWNAGDNGDPIAYMPDDVIKYAPGTNG